MTVATTESNVLNKIRAIKELGFNPYPSHYLKDHKAIELDEKYHSLESGAETTDLVSVAGRIMAIRNSGLFLDVHDDTGKIQVFCHEKNLEPKLLSLLQLFDLGDIVGVKGKVRRTKRGELTVDAVELTPLSKAMLPLPDKYHGVSDTEVRYRQRYLDLISNEESKKTLLQRSQIINSIRKTLVEKEYLEVETPMLHPIAGGAIAKPFVTHHQALDMQLYLRIAPELYLKRLLIGGLSERIFEINRCFRNEGLSTRHNPEFTSLEAYQAYANDQDMIALTESIVSNAAMQILGTLEIEYGDKKLSLKTPWQRKSMSELVQEETNIDFMRIHSDQEARDAVKSVGIEVTGSEGWGTCLEMIFAEKVEHKLIQPIHIIGFPKEISPLAKGDPNDPRLTERFETYINGWEIANGFSELNDPQEQKLRFIEQLQNEGKSMDELDQDFLTALEYAMPPAGGLGIGIDRLVMILTNSPSIREVIAFPTLRPKS